MSERPSLGDLLKKAGQAAEDVILIVILGGMIAVAGAQIVLRNVFDSGLFWGDELLRLLVLWIAVAGALAASRSDKHINIAILDRFLPATLQTVVKLVVHLFTAMICAVVAWYSLAFVRLSHEFGDVVLNGVPAWIAQSVIPAGFALICWRYLLHSLDDIKALIKRKRTP